ncbi:HlyD family secretion protein [Tepidibacter hydrothermalis]|uniref:HlyD family efflux transporter periplasmic adaptor subunit n=1 Tax=Tepidibacter hydrothermalis TaxID=3036126 RepID=A0ABY8EB49_9FIRM|nr:HlyD family efflux transporter periplasmic adaptor subunit [Tepidibacter hydrothermalis]WFD08824.1 HlyD family efflux transporter periplasmic adaptor subunit [Tepidibacter hydrothermalis]
MRRLKVLSILLILFSITGCSKDTSLVYTGTLEATEVDLNSEVSSTVKNVFVDEGSSVKKGDKILQIDDASLLIKLNQANAQLNASKADFEDVSNGSRNEEIKKAQANLESIDALLSGAKSEYEYVRDNYNDLKSLYEQDAVSKKELDGAKTSMDKAYSNFQNVQKQYESAKSSVDLVLSGSTSEKIKKAKAQVDYMKANVDLLNYQLSKATIYSPIDGVIQNINYDEGELVLNGANVANIINLTDRWVKIYIPQKQLNKVSLNQEVNIKADYLKDKKLTGKIVYISSKAEFTPKNVESKESKEEMVFEVKVKIDDQSNLLKPGMLVDIDLEGDLNGK